MARRRQRRRHGQPDRARNQAELKRHIKKLGLSSESEYRDWCRNRGLGDGLNKSSGQKAKERQLAQRLQGDAVLQRRHRHTRRPQNAIQALYDKSMEKGRLGADYLYRVRQLFAALESDTRARRAFLDLLLAVEHDGKLLSVQPVLSERGGREGNTYIDGLAALARRHEQWLQPLAGWSPPSHNPRKQFAGLARHLLARYDVPAFMDAAWFGGDTAAARQQQDWFVHIGTGHNIRTADVPVALTKRMAHVFLQTPDGWSIPHALRRAQVVGQDGSEVLAKAVCHTRLGASFQNEDFWSGVILFLCNNPMLDPACVGPIVDYIQHQKYETREIILPGGQVEEADPPHPDYSMRCRTMAKLLRQVEEWHQELAREILDRDAQPEGDAARRPRRRQRLMQWERSGIGELNLEEQHQGPPGDLHWTIRELLSNRELSAEGRDMHHCVLSYARSCRNGSTSIWSMSVKQDGRRHHILTLAIDPRARTVTQMRGRYNVLPVAKSARKHRSIDNSYRLLLLRCRTVLERWLQREHLTLAC